MSNVSGSGGTGVVKARSGIITHDDIARIRGLLDCYQIAPGGEVADGLLAEAAKILKTYQAAEPAADILAGATINDITERQHQAVVIPAGWIKVKNGECPLEKGTLIDVLYRDGDEGYGLPAHDEDICGVSRNGCSCAAAWFFQDGEPGDIIAYRLHTPEAGKA